MLKVFVEPQNVWNYFQQNRERLKGVCDIIAEIELEGVDLQVVLTEKNSLPRISVELSESNEPLVDECIKNSDDCEDIVKTYFKIAENLSEEETSNSMTKVQTADELDFLIVARRETQLLSALKEFMTVAMGYSDDDLDFDIKKEEFTEILDCVENTLYECGYAIYRPQIIEDDEGNMVLFESSIFE